MSAANTKVRRMATPSRNSTRPSPRQPRRRARTAAPSPGRARDPASTRWRRSIRVLHHGVRRRSRRAATTRRASWSSFPTLLLEQIVDQALDVPLDGVSRRPVSLVLRDVVPRASLARRGRRRRQRAANRENDRRRVDVGLSNRRRFQIRRRETVVAQAFQRADRQIGLRVDASIDRTRPESSLGCNLVEVGGRDDALGGAVFAHEHDGGFGLHHRLNQRQYAQNDECLRNHAVPSAFRDFLTRISRLRSDRAWMRDARRSTRRTRRRPRSRRTLARSTSTSVYMPPRTTFQFFSARYSGPTPRTGVPQF